jgi:serine/threonine protein kinase
MKEGDILQGKYLIEREIGRGGMGVLFFSRHKDLPLKFAIKCLPPALMQDEQSKERFLGEAHKQSLLSHPNIVRVIDCFEEYEQRFIVMEYVEGTNLEQKIKNEGSLQETEALQMLRPVLEAMQYAHDHNIIHRDIKPSNILIGLDNKPMLTDFGIAVLTSASRLTDISNTTRTPIGTLGYMSPEQMISHNIDHRSDIYSFGIVLYEMLTGKALFDGETDFAISEQQKKLSIPDTYLSKAGISKSTVRVLRKALELQISKRYQTCAEFIQDIDVPPAPQLKKLTLVTGLLLCLGIVSYYSFPKDTLLKLANIITEWTSSKPNLTVQNLPSKPEKVTNTVTKEIPDIKQQRDTAFAMIQAATEQVVIYCTKKAELPAKLSNLAISEKNGYFDLKKKYSKQIDDMNKTMNDSKSKYKDFVGKLNKIPATVVNEEFNHYTKQLMETERTDQKGKAETVRKAFQNGDLNIEIGCQ